MPRKSINSNNADTHPMTRRSQSINIIKDNGNITAETKPKAVLTKKQFERQFINLIDNKDSKIHDILQDYIDKIIIQRHIQPLQTIQHDLNRNEAWHNIKEQKIDESISKVSEKLNKFQQQLDEKYVSLSSEFVKFKEEVNNAIKKSNYSSKKYYDKLDVKFSEMDESYKKLHDEHSRNVRTLKEALDSHTVDLNDLKFRFKSVRHKLSQVKNENDVNLNASIENLTDSLNQFDLKLTSPTKSNIMYNRRNISPNRTKSSASNNLLIADQVRLSELEEIVANLQIQASNNNDKLKELKYLYKDFSKSNNNSNSTVPVHSLKSKSDISSTDVQELKKRLKDLGSSTTLICRSLQDGLNDVQRTSLDLYEWGQRVHSAVGIIALRTGLQYNPCPNVPIPSQRIK